MAFAGVICSSQRPVMAVDVPSIRSVPSSFYGMRQCNLIDNIQMCNTNSLFGASQVPTPACIHPRYVFNLQPSLLCPRAPLYCAPTIKSNHSRRS